MCESRNGCRLRLMESICVPWWEIILLLRSDYTKSRRCKQIVNIFVSRAASGKYLYRTEGES